MERQRIKRLQQSSIAGIAALVDEAAFNPSAWVSVLEEIGRLIPGSKLGLQVVDARSERATPMITSGFRADVVEAYAQRYGSINPYLPIMLSAPVLRPLFSERQLPAAAMRHTEFYNDWLLKGGGIDASSGIKLVDTAGRLGVLVAHYEGKRADAMNDAFAPLFSQLAPRMRRALDAAHLQVAARWMMSGGPLLAAISDPAFIVSRELTLHDANAAAHELIAQGDLILVGSRDRLRFRHADFGRAFADQVEWATREEPTGGRPAGQDPIVALTAEHLSLSAITLRPSLAHATGLTKLWTPRTLALVIVRSHAPGADDIGERLMKVHRLSSSEARLAIAMTEGQPLTVVSEELGINYETARSQLKRVFEKMSINRQSELVAYLAKFKLK